MSYQLTTATKKLLALTHRIKAVCGGTSASKTISILMILIDKAQSNKNLRIDVMSESYPHLTDGAIKDFKSIMLDRGYWKDENWTKTPPVYTFETGSIIKFISIDNIGKAHGPRRDILFVNEGNHLDWEIILQLIQRTSGDIWIDWNPSNEFWYYTEIKGKMEHDFITLTYLDNEGLQPSIKEFIESRKENKRWWTVYGLGQLGEVEGKIYKDWQIIDSIPHEARLERRGIDFGYTNDPTAIVDIYKYNGGYIVDEVTYQKGLSNKQISDILTTKERVFTIADSAEPKSIDELCAYGHNVVGANKGADSVRQGIQIVQDQRVSVTSRSLNIIKEYRNYMWESDKNGKILNEPEGGFDHAMDAMRYAMSSYLPSSFFKEAKKVGFKYLNVPNKVEVTSYE